MRFVVSSGLLQKKLQSINGLIGTNRIVPILSTFYFSIENNQLTVVSSNLDITMKTTLEIQSNEDGIICIQAQVLLEYLKNLPEQPLTFDVNLKDFGIEIISDQGKYKIVGEDHTLFPQIPTVEDSKTFTMSAVELTDGIAKAIVAVNIDEMRPAMSGVYFELSNNHITFVATDAHRLIRCIKTDVNCSEEASFIVPRKFLQQIKNSLNETTDVLISYNDKQLHIKGDNIEMFCRLIDAKFPDYKIVIPADNPYKLILNKNDFMSALRRVSVFSNKTTNQVVLDINGNNLHLYAQDIDYSFEGNEQMACQYDGEDMKIAFNSKFLIELIQIVETDEIIFEFSTPSRASLIKLPENKPNEDLLILIMPLMIGI